MKNWKTLVALVLTVVLSCSSALACTSLYVGSDFTEDGATILARSEDLANSRNKVYYVSPAGNHKAGEFYQGCYGFTYTFTHDSYGYNAFSDDNLEGVDYVCPNCGGTHAHTPYEEGGANEMGLMVSASEALTAGKQQEIYDAFITMKADIAAAEDPAKVSTDASMAMAYDVFEMLSGLAKELTK